MSKYDAYIWYCGDEYCDCHEPRIYQDGVVIWQGTWVSGPSEEEREMMEKELNDAKREYGIE